MLKDLKKEKIAQFIASEKERIELSIKNRRQKNIPPIFKDKGMAHVYHSGRAHQEIEDLRELRDLEEVAQRKYSFYDDILDFCFKVLDAVEPIYQYCLYFPLEKKDKGFKMIDILEKNKKEFQLSEHQLKILEKLKNAFYENKNNIDF